VSDFFAKYLTSETSQWFESEQIVTSEIELLKKS